MQNWFLRLLLSIKSREKDALGYKQMTPDLL
jgi:hypothetical protein